MVTVQGSVSNSAINPIEDSGQYTLSHQQLGKAGNTSFGNLESEKGRVFLAVYKLPYPSIKVTLEFQSIAIQSCIQQG